MVESTQPRPEDWEETLEKIWKRTMRNMAIRSYEIDREFGVRIPPHELAKMSFEHVISRIRIDTSSRRALPPQSGPSSKPSRESTKLTPEEEAKARKVFRLLNWD